MTKKFFGIMLVLGMVLNLLAVPIFASEGESGIRGYKTVDIDFESPKWEAGNSYPSTHANWTKPITLDASTYTVEEEEGKGQVLAFEGGQVSAGIYGMKTLVGVTGVSQNKFILKFDIKSEAATGIDFYARRTTPTSEVKLFTIKDQKFQNEDFWADTWYTLQFTFDLAGENYHVLWTDSTGEVIWDSGEQEYLWGDYTSFTHFRMFAGAGKVSIDNLEVTEWYDKDPITIDALYDSEGSSEVDYGTKSLTAEVSGDVLLDSNEIFVKEKNSDNTIAVTKAETDSADDSLVNLTLGGALSAATDYELVFSDKIKIAVTKDSSTGEPAKTAPYGEQVTYDFTTTLTTFITEDDEVFEPDEPIENGGTKVFDYDFEGEEWVVEKSYPSGNSNWSSTVTLDSAVFKVAEEDGKGKILTFEGGQMTNGYTLFGIQSFSQDKFSLKFDVKIAGTGLDFRMRRTPNTSEPQLFIVKDNVFQGKPFLADTWYTLEFIFDLINENYRIVWTDASGELIHDTGEESYKWGSFTSCSHFRMFAAKSSGLVSMDNVELIEWINQPEITSVKDAAGSETIDFNGNQIIVKTTKQLVADKDFVKVTRSLDGSEVLVADAVLDSSDKTNLVITLGSPLQSASKYMVTLKEGLKMSFRESPVTADVKKVFKTSARPEGDMTDVKFSPNKSLGVVSYKADLVNPSDTAKTMMLLISSYDKEGRLFKTEFQTVNVAPGGSLTTSAQTIEVPDKGSVKVFALGDVTTFTPLNNNIHTHSFK